MATGTILTIFGHCDPAYTTLTLEGFEYFKTFNHGASFSAPVFAFQQPIPDALIYGRDGSTPMTFAVNNAGSVDGLINHITEKFILELRLPQGSELDMTTISFDTLRATMLSEINTLFGLSLA
jgi:hypothetical protein